MSESALSYQVPLHTQFARFVLRATFRRVFRLLYRVMLQGFENIPTEGPYLVAYNHVSIVDPPFILTFWPVPMEAIGAIEAWSRKEQAPLVKLYGTIPVHRGQVDRRLIEIMLAVLQAGRPLMIAPEGTRSQAPGMQRAWPGIGYLMERMQVPVVPVGVVGGTPDSVRLALRLERPPLEMRVGNPVYPLLAGESGESRRVLRQRNTDLVMERLAALLPQEYRGVYAGRV